MKNLKTNKIKNSNWWDESHGFFGDFYMEGDNSIEGFLAKEKQELKKRTVAEVNGIVNLLALKRKQSILDVPCGYGRHSIELARRNYQVTGYDINQIHLKVAKEKAKAQNFKINFQKKNMIALKDKSKFDAIINMFYSFGFFETDEENMEVLKNFYRALKPKGKFLMHTDVNIPLIIKGKYKENEIRKLKSGNRLQIIDRYNSKTKRINGAWIIIKSDGTKERKDYSVRVYKKEEFIDMCLGVGFKECVAYCDWAGKPYDENGEEIMFIAKK